MDLQIPYLQELFKSCLNDRDISPTWKEVKITLIPKEGKDLAYLEDYWPISLLNIDYKILTVLLAKKLFITLFILSQKIRKDLLKIDIERKMLEKWSL